MATATTLDLQGTLWAWAQNSLDNHLYENAAFLAERVVAESPNEASKLLLATCYFQLGAANRAEMVLQGSKAPQNRYLLALCLMRLGKLGEAQHALLGSSAPDPDASAQLPNGASGLYLMGMICMKQQQRPKAIKYFTRSLVLNPFLWSAYEALCQLGAPLPEHLKSDNVPLPPQPVGHVSQSVWSCGAEVPPSTPGCAGSWSLVAPPITTPVAGYAAAASATPVRVPPVFAPSDSGASSTAHHLAGVPSSAAYVSGVESVRCIP